MFRLRRWRYVAEAAGLWLFLVFMRRMPVGIASAIGDRLGLLFGRFAPQTRTARQNVRLAFPDISEAEQNRIIRDMWRHLGRIAAEFAHLPGHSLFKRMDIEGLENMPDAGHRALFFSGHLGNWELLSSVAQENGHPLTLIYRHANNPLADRMVTRIRATHCAQLIAKGHKSAGQLVRALKGGSSIAMLTDQKMNNGIAIPFFERPAMTAPAIAQLALRFDLPIIPARVMRTKGAHFKATIYPPLVIEKTGNEQKDVFRIMCAINQILEEWIREAPEQWFWVHRRWPKD